MNEIVLLNLRISMWGVSRVLPDHEYEVDADKKMVRATKKILECPEYEFLLQLKRSIHRRLRTLALPGKILRAGVYSVSVAMVQTIEATLEDFLARWGVGVMGLGEVWDLRVREVEDRLRALYDEEDYPSWERVRNCFDVRWNYFSMNTPQVLQAISSKLFVREQAKATVQWNEMLDEIRDGLRLTFKELVDALMDCARTVTSLYLGRGPRQSGDGYTTNFNHIRSARVDRKRRGRACRCVSRAVVETACDGQGATARVSRYKGAALARR
ncbi:MAG: hypothetical protein L0Y72_24345 [Gemmataceae bacterium]|nr:hypothetical protein [Gemmataceae bacterium]MCI0742176.1 hypothetical protein [Gemmataceae bacterium]